MKKYENGIEMIKEQIFFLVAAITNVDHNQTCWRPKTLKFQTKINNNQIYR